MAKYLLYCLMTMLLVSCAPVSTARALSDPPLVASGQAAAQAQVPPHEIDPWLNSLWFDMSMGSQLVGLYNEYAGRKTLPAPTM